MSAVREDYEDDQGGHLTTRQRRAGTRLGDVIAAGRVDAVLRDPARMQLQDFHRGLPVSTLSSIFRLDPATVKKRLADCPIKEARKGGYLYDLAEAAQYLVKPVFNAKKMLETMKATELPPTLQAAFWDAALKRQKWEENAGDLWRTEKVMEVLAEAFKTIKQTVLLWSDTVGEQTPLTDEQQKIIVALGDALQRDIHAALVLNAGKTKTLSTIDEAPKAEIEIDEVDEDEIDPMSLV